MPDLYIYDAVRTPRAKGKAGAGFHAIQPADLVRQLVNALVDRHGVAMKDIDHLTLGCVGQLGTQGGHLALVTKLRAALPEQATAWTLNNYCTSGLSAVQTVADKIQAGSAEFAFAGGVEVMSQVPFMADKASYYTDRKFSADLQFIPVALAADVLATKETVDRKDLDAVTLESHDRAVAAHVGGYEKSLIPIKNEDGIVVSDRDEYVRTGQTMDALAALEPAFLELGKHYAPIVQKALGMTSIHHVHTIAHCPGIADGAGLAALGTRAAGLRRNLAPRAKVLGYAEAGGNPVLSLTAGRLAMEKALAKAGLSLQDMDVIEYMEAFAVVPALFYRDTGIDRSKVNIFGGHVAKGHPLGASGAILLSTVLDAMDHKNAGLGLVVASAASGIGSAMVLQREAT